jgi:hypothetical protein
MEFPDIVAPDDVRKRHVVIKNVIGKHAESIFDAVGIPVSKEGFSDFERVGRHDDFLCSDYGPRHGPVHTGHYGAGIPS